MTGKRDGWRLRRLLLELGTGGGGALDFRHRHVEVGLNRCRVMTSLAGPHDTLDWSISHGIGPAQVGPFSLTARYRYMADVVSASDSQQSQSQQGLFPVRQGDTENQQDARLRCNLCPPPGRRAIGDRRQKTQQRAHNAGFSGIAFSRRVQVGVRIRCP